MKLLVIDIGGRNAKLWWEGQTDSAKIPSGKRLTPTKLIEEMNPLIVGREFDLVSIGYPGDVVHGRPVKDPYNLGPGWVGFDWEKALGHPVRMMNDACMQALGSYEGGRMLYLGLGTSIGTTLIIDGRIVPLSLGHLICQESKSFEDLLSRKALAKIGVRVWRKAVNHAATILKQAFMVDYVVLGGGNAKRLTDIPEFCRRGGNFNAYVGGQRMWEDAGEKADQPIDPPIEATTHAH